MLDRTLIKKDNTTEFAKIRMETLSSISRNNLDNDNLLKLAKLSKGSLKTSIANIAKTYHSVEKLWQLVELLSLDEKEKSDILKTLSCHI